MTESIALEALLAEVESNFDDDDIYCLYLFTWFLSGYRGSLTEDQIVDICHQAYTEIRRRHPLKLVWVDWPKIDPTLARDADPGTVLDFTLAPDTRLSKPLLALVRG